MSSIPTSLDALLRRKHISEALKESGFPVEITSLATMASRGGGPPFHSFGRIPLYRWGDALKWAQSRLSAPRSSTSEGDAVEQAARAEVRRCEPPTPDAPRVATTKHKKLKRPRPKPTKTSALPTHC
jgi:hypothetical protein